MIDILYFSIAIIVVGIIAAVAHIHEKRGECDHQWSHWTPSETEWAYVQQRVCSKCGFVQTNQFKKFKDEQ